MTAPFVKGRWIKYNALRDMLYIGIDIVEISRISGAISRWGERFLRRIYTEEELKHYRKQLPSLAVRFAAKEAVMKIMGFKGCWREIEILNDPQGKPQVKLYGKMKKRAEEKGLKELELSLSHSRFWAIACAVGRG